MRYFMVLGIALLYSFGSSQAHADGCEAVIALSKTTSNVVLNKSAVDDRANAFCKTESHGRGSASGGGGEYDGFGLDFNHSSSSQDYSRYCEDDNSHKARKDAFDQYVMSIAPEAYHAYEECLKMSKELQFDIGGIQPGRFSLYVSLNPQTAASSSAQVTFSPSDGVTCKWDNAPGEVASLQGVTTSLLVCTRSTADQAGSVDVYRKDATNAKLTLPWPAYRGGVPVDDYAALQESVNRVLIRLSEIDSAPRITLYECPVGPDHNVDAPWASVGCLGQITSRPTCTTWFGGNGRVPAQTRQCKKLGDVKIPGMSGAITQTDLDAYQAAEKHW